MKVKLVHILVPVIVVCGIALLSVGCQNQPDSNAAGIQTATAQLGSITITVTGTGNLALKNKQSLSFGQTGLLSGVETAKVSEVDVVEGQLVELGQALIKADTKDWLNRINNFKHQLDSARANLVQTQAGSDKAQLDLATAQVSLAGAQNTLAVAQSGLANAQYNLAVSQFNLKAQQDVQTAQDKIDNTNIQLQQALVMYEGAVKSTSGDTRFWTQIIAEHRADLATYQKDLRDLLTDPAVKDVSITDINTKVAQVQQAQTGVNQAQAGIVQAQSGIIQAQANVELAKKNIELTQVNLVVAQNAVDDAQTALTDEQNSAQVIIAPFKGLITKVDVNQGDIVQRNANIIEIGEPDKFVANVLVTQRDVVSVKIGNEAAVSFDALPGISFPARITRIASLAIIQQGVVNYKVTVEVVLDLGTPAASQAALKDGFTAIVDIPVQKKDNILIVPSRAVSHQGQDYTVQLLSGTTSETRIVTVGITDYQNTEIVDGLKPGDRVILPAIPVSTPGSGGLFGGG